MTSWARAKRLVNWATGDREHEADALVEEKREQGAGDVTQLEAEGTSAGEMHDRAATEVRRAHGDLGAGTKASEEPDVADPSDADLHHGGVRPRDQHAQAHDHDHGDQKQDGDGGR